MTEMACLLRKIQKTQTPVKGPPKRSREMSALIDRIATKKWLRTVEEHYMLLVQRLKWDVRFIEHLPGCLRCRAEVMLDVERYNGTRLFWYLCLDNSQYLEEEYPDCPKEGDYLIDNYWLQVERYRKTGTTESKEANTIDFILARAKWAYKIFGKQIRLTRQLLKLVRNWNFSDECSEQYNSLSAKLGTFDCLVD